MTHRLASLLQRRRFLLQFSALGLAPALPVAAAETARLSKPKSAWRTLLPAASYAVLFEEDTERPYSSPLNGEKHKGTFVCAACYLPLFDSAKKYDSGTGWPSFWEALPGAIATTVDHKLVVARTEYHCVRCGGHQGHIFDDGPAPTHLRHCNNGLALRFIPSGEALPALRS